MSVTNNTNLMGRITKDLQLQQTAGQNGQPGTSYVKFTVAINRTTSKNNQPITDFIPCTAWGKTAENICKFFGKGRLIALQGEIQTSTYTDQNGQKKSSWTVNVNSFAFTGEKSQQNGNNGGQYQQPPQYQPQQTPQYQQAPQQQYQQAPAPQPQQQQPQQQYQQQAPAPQYQPAPQQDMGDLQDFSFDDGNFDDNF